MTQPTPELQMQQQGILLDPLGHLQQLPQIKDHLASIARSLETLATEPERSTTPLPQFVQNVYGSLETPTPPSSKSVESTPKEAPKATDGPIPPAYRAIKADKEFITLENGMQAPTYLVRAIADLGERWHESTIPEARAAIVATIIEEQNKKTETLYPFCGNDDPAIREKASPCILRMDHRGKHKDNDDGVWDA